MIIDSFPTLEDLGRPAIIGATARESDSGIILISGYKGSGVTTTITALAHEMKYWAWNVVHVCLDESDRIPGVDSILVDEIDDNMFNYLLGEGRPDVLIFKDTQNQQMFLLAAKLAEAGSIVIGGMRSTSAEDAIKTFRDTIPVGPYITRDVRKSVLISVHQQIDNSNVTSEQAVKLLSLYPVCRKARDFFAQEESNRYANDAGHHGAILYTMLTFSY